MESFLYNPDKKLIQTEKASSQVNDEGKFIYNGKIYTLVNFTTTLVKHSKKGFGDMEVKYFDHLVVMEEECCKQGVIDLANILQYQLEVGCDTSNETIGSKDQLIDTLNRNRYKIIHNIENNDSNLNLNDNLKEIIKMLVEQVKQFDSNKMIDSLPKLPKLKRIFKRTTPNNVILEELIKYIIKHNTFDDSVVNYRGLTIYPDTLFILILIGVMLDFHNVNIVNMVNFCTIQDLLIHMVIEMVYNVITMKIDRELFVLERNSMAKEIKHRYYFKFPELKKENYHEVLALLDKNQKFKNMLEKESINMFPYIALYGQSDKKRVEFYYIQCSKNKELKESYENKIRFLDPKVFINLLQEFSISHSKDFERYNTELFISLISNFMITTEVISPIERSTEDMECN
ncbi:P51 [Aratus pisonii nudivirus]|nr:P51 [Aratus pisonii nudivirus]